MNLESSCPPLQQPAQEYEGPMVVVPSMGADLEVVLVTVDETRLTIITYLFRTID